MASSYTDYDRKRPRIVQRGQENETYAPESIGHTQLMSIEKPGLFDGISIAQIAAGAAAAATSVVLASHIGIGGSVIGAAVSSVVTVVSSQIYRRFLDAGAEKIRRGGAAVHDAAVAARGHVPSVRSQQADAETLADPTTIIDGRVKPIPGARVAPAELQARAAAERENTQRKVALFSIAIAAVAVAACALLIMLGTSGAGIGAKIEPLFSAPSSKSSEAPAADSANLGDSEASESGAPNSAPGADATTDENQTANSDPAAETDGGSTATPTAPSTETGTDGHASDTTSQGSGASSNDSGAAGNAGSDNVDGDTSSGNETDASTGSSSNGVATGTANATSKAPAATARS